MPAVSAADMLAPSNAEASAPVAQRVERAREIQRLRYIEAGHPAVFTNAAAGPALIEQVVNPDKDSQTLLLQASERFRLSARVLELAGAVLDLDDGEFPHLGKGRVVGLRVDLDGLQWDALVRAVAGVRRLR